MQSLKLLTRDNSEYLFEKNNFDPKNYYKQKSNKLKNLKKLKNVLKFKRLLQFELVLHLNFKKFATTYCFAKQK